MNLGTFSASMYMYHKVAEFPTRNSRQSPVDRGGLAVDSCDSPQHQFSDFFVLFINLFFSFWHTSNIK